MATEMEDPRYKEILFDAVRWWIDPANKEKVGEYLHKMPSGDTQGWAEERTSQLVLEALSRFPQEIAALMKELYDG